MSGGSPIDNLVDAVVDPVKDAGSWIDDKVNEEIPGGWYTVAAATGAYFAPEYFYNNDIRNEMTF
jgi:hypothetical protein